MRDPPYQLVQDFFHHFLPDGFRCRPHSHPVDMLDYTTAHVAGFCDSSVCSLVYTCIMMHYVYIIVEARCLLHNEIHRKIPLEDASQIKRFPRLVTIPHWVSTSLPWTSGMFNFCRGKGSSVCVGPLRRYQSQVHEVLFMDVQEKLIGILGWHCYKRRVKDIRIFTSIHVLCQLVKPY